MGEYLFELGQTVYSAMGWQIGRYVVSEYVLTTTKEGSKLEYILVDPTGRKTGFSEEDIKSCFFRTLDECRDLATQGWKVKVDEIQNQINTITDEVFDEIAQKAKAKAESQGK